MIAHLVILPCDKSRHQEIQRRCQGGRGHEATANVNGVQVVAGPTPHAAQPPRIAPVENYLSGEGNALRVHVRPAPKVWYVKSAEKIPTALVAGRKLPTELEVRDVGDRT